MMIVIHYFFKIHSIFMMIHWMITDPNMLESVNHPTNQQRMMIHWFQMIPDHETTSLDINNRYKVYVINGYCKFGNVVYLTNIFSANQLICAWTWFSASRVSRPTPSESLRLSMKHAPWISWYQHFPICSWSQSQLFTYILPIWSYQYDFPIWSYQYIP